MCLIALVVAAGCEPAPVEERAPIPIPTTPVDPDPRVACRVDADCEVFVGCCAHCSPTGTVVSLNKAYGPLGSLLTLTFYCPMCAEGGCITRAPQRTAICKRGTCARRDTRSADDSPTGVASAIEVDNDPEIMKRAETVMRTAALMHYACLRLGSCATPPPDCLSIAVPDAIDPATTACRNEIDKLTCTPGNQPDFLAILQNLATTPACAPFAKL